MLYQTVAHEANNVHMIPYKHNQLNYMHQSMFLPPIATLIKAIDNDFLEGFTFMKYKLVHKYLAKSPATAKGRMKRPHNGIRSTRARPEDRVIYAIPTKTNPLPHLIPDDEFPTKEYPAGTVHIFIVLAQWRTKKK